jgi:hypothetical protein
LKSAELTEQDLSNIDFRNANLSNAVLQEVKFTGATLAGAALNHVLLENCDMNGSDLSDARFTTSAILYSSFEGASMPRTGFMWAHVVGSKFSRAVLEEATLTYAVLNRVNLRGASLRRADLTLVSFLDSDLAEADFSGSRLGWTTFDSLTLGSARGLDSVQHRGPSTLRHQVYLQRHELPDSFLRGIGLPESAIESAIQLQPQEFHSCFISYSTKDQDFAATLHTNLQQNGVRCWLATEDLKIGEQFRNRIDESIMSHDKLLLVLSRDSIESPWVGSEVETAFEKEHRSGDLVLFPIRSARSFGLCSVWTILVGVG